MPELDTTLPDAVQETMPVRPSSSISDTHARPSRNEFLTAEHHDISIAVITAMLFPGGGQIYNGQVGKGVSLVVITLAGLIFIALRVHAPALLVFGLIVGILLWLTAIIDAAVIAHRLIHHQPVRLWRWF